jgi:serine O-acetyltransferase
MELSKLIEKILSIRRVNKLNKRLSDINCEIPPSTIFHHKGLGVVMGGKVKLGENVQIYQHVTLGAKGLEIKNGKYVSKGGYPTIEDNVIIYAYASVLGGVKVGHDSVIAAYSLVVDNVPPYSIVAGVPAKVVKNTNQNKKKISEK